MPGDQGELASLFCKERPGEHCQVETHAEGLGQMNVRFRVPLPLSPHCQRHRRQRTGVIVCFLAFTFVMLCFSLWANALR